MKWFKSIKTMQKEMKESLNTIYKYVEIMKAIILQQKAYIEELEKKEKK